MSSTKQRRKSGTRIEIPDLEETKNKKIVQLTKVIYHLNIQCEEHDTEMHNMCRNYEIEIKQILQDSYEKINSAQEKCITWEKRAENNELYKKALAKYEHEKKLTQERVADINTQHKENIKTIENEHKQNAELIHNKYSNEIKSLQIEAQNTKKEMTARLEQMQQMTQTMTRNHKTDIFLLQSGHDKQMEEQNEKHGVILHRIKQQYEQTTSEMKNSHANAIESLNINQKTRLESINNQHKVEIEEMQNAHQKKLCKLHNTIKNTNLEKDTIEVNFNKSQKTIIGLQHKINDCKENIQKLEANNKQMATKVSTQIIQIQLLEENKSQLTQQLEKTTKNLRWQEKETKSNESKYKQARNTIQKMQTEITNINNKNDKYQHELQSCKIILIDTQNQTKQLKKQNQNISEDFLEMKQELTNNINQYKKTIIELKNEVQQKEDHLLSQCKQNKTLQTKFNSLKKATIISKSVVKEMQKKVMNMKTLWSSFIKSYDHDFLLYLKNNFIQKTQQLIINQRNKMQDLEIKFENQMEKMKASKDSMEKKLLHEIQQLKQTNIQLKSESSEIENKLQKVQEKFHQTVTENENAIQNKSNEIKQLQIEIEQLNKKSTNNSQQSYSEIEDLNSKLQSLSITLENTQSLYEETEQKLQSNEIEFQHEKQKMNLLNQQTLKEKMNVMTELKQLKQIHSQDQSQSNKCLQDMQLNHEQRMTRLRETNTLQLQNLNHDHQKLLSNLKSDHTELLQKINQQNKMQKQALESDYQLSLNSTENKYKEIMKERKLRFEEKMKKTNMAHNKNMENQLTKIAKLEEENNDIESEYKQQLHCIKYATDKTIKELEADNEQVINDLELLTQNLQELQTNYDSKVEECDDVRSEFEEDKENLLMHFREEQQRFTNEQKTLKSQFEHEKVQLQEQFNQMLHEKEEEFAENLQQQQIKFETIQKEFKKLRTKYSNRPPRTEDIEKIKSLQSMIEKKKKEVLHIQKTMNKMKGELLNREKNFNQVFGRTPKVGIMNISKISNSKKKRKSKQKT